MKGSAIFQTLCLLWFCFSDVTGGQNLNMCESLSENREDCSTCHFLNQSKGYECQWCKTSGCVAIDNTQCRQAETCGEPVITNISPTDGPPEGGTVLTIEGYNFGIQSHVTVSVAGVPCNNISFVSRKINCITSKKSLNATKKLEESRRVIVTVDGKNSTEDIQFTYKMPKITGIYPRQGIMSGGRTIYLSGTNLNIGNMKYEVELVESSESQTPIECNIIQNLSLKGNLTCKPKRAIDIGVYKLKVIFDTNTKVESNLQFEYLSDPVIITTEPAQLKSIKSGGTRFRVIGDGFVAIDSLTVGIDYSKESTSPCRILTQGELVCTYPRNIESEKRRRKRVTMSYIVIYLDGFSDMLPSSVLYVDDPLFAAFNNNATYTFDPTADDFIKLVGKFLTTAAKEVDYHVFVGTAECAIKSLTETELICWPPGVEPTPTFNENKLFIWVKVGNIRQTLGVIEYSSKLPSSIIISMVISVLIIVALVGLVAVLIHRRKQLRKTRRIAYIRKAMHDLK